MEQSIGRTEISVRWREYGNVEATASGGVEDDKYTLKALPGKFSGLHLLAIMYTAFRQIDPTMDTGADFSPEYQPALEMQQK